MSGPTFVGINDRGLRVGQDHHKAVLSDVEVEALIRDRGPDDSPFMSYTQLAKKYGISKSGVRDILIGRRRGQAKTLVEGIQSERIRQHKVRAVMYVGLRTRAILRRLGGGRWIDRVAAQVDAELQRAPSISPEQALTRVLKGFGAVE